MGFSASDSSSERWLRRIWPLLHWHFRLISERGEVWGGLATYIVIVTVMSLPNSARLGVAPGADYLGRLQMIHWYVALGSAQSLAVLSVLDRTSGILAFIRLTDLRAGQWIAYQLGSVIISLIPAWIARIPFYTLAFSLGGASLDRIVAVEALQGIGFLFVASIALFFSRLSTTNQAAGFATMVAAALFEGLLYLPELIVSVGRWLLLIPSGLVDRLDAFAFSARRLSLIHYVNELPDDAEGWGYAAAMTTIHLAAAATALLLLRRLLFSNLDSEFTEVGGAAETAKPRRRGRVVRPRSWRDALAWQAFHFHEKGPRSIQLKLLSYAACGVVTVLALESNPPIAAVLIVVSTGVAFVLALFSLIDCIAKEIRWQTFPTLAMLPYDAKELFQGWSRGIRWRILPDVVWINLALAAVLIHSASSASPLPWLVPLWIGMMVAVALAPPMVLLFSLQTTRSFVSFFRATLVLVLLLLPFGSGLVMGVQTNPWTGLVVFVAVCLAVRTWMLSEINPAFARRLALLA